MKDLLTQYSFEEIVIFIFVLIAALKEAVELWKWFKNFFKKEITKEDDMNSRIEQDENDIKELKNSVKNISDSVNLLIESDKDDIKAWITEQHHKFCYSKSKTIDAYSLDCIKRRYKHYKDEGGNSFVESLMRDLEGLTIYTPDPNEIEIKK